MSEQLLKQILEELHDIKAEQQTTNQRLDKIETEQQTTNLRLDKIETQQHTTNLRLDRIETELTNIKENVALVANDQKNNVINMLTKIDENITDVKSRVRNIENVQDRQHTVIDLLSTRSIQQEAELRELKGIN